MKCIVGLGNPGRKYANTRHNVGYMVLREIAGRFGVSFSKDGFAETTILNVESAAGENFALMLARPLTYMNLSGQAVVDIARNHGIAGHDILVVHDDMDLPFGKIRVRRKGSSGGHNGIESIALHLGTTEFPRVKVGIGRPPEGVDPVDFVTTPFERADAKLLEEVVAKAASAAMDVVVKGLEYAMQEYNGQIAASDGEEK